MGEFGGERVRGAFERLPSTLVVERGAVEGGGAVHTFSVDVVGREGGGSFGRRWIVWVAGSFGRQRLRASSSRLSFELPGASGCRKLNETTREERNQIVSLIGRYDYY